MLALLPLSSVAVIMQSPPLAPGTLAVHVLLKMVALTPLSFGQPAPLTSTVTEVPVVGPKTCLDRRQCQTGAERSE
jgi:hypothetical protein